jgi:hypothetical protein
MVRSVILGVVAAALFAIIAFFVFPRTVVTTVFLWPGTVLASAFGGYLPDRIIYSLASEGGAPAFLALTLIGSILSWVCALSAVFVVWRKLTSSDRPNQSLQPTAGRSDE